MRERGGFYFDCVAFYGDPNVRYMTFQQQGIYQFLLSVQWLEGSIPADTEQLTKLVNTASQDSFDHVTFSEKIWPAIAPCFRAKSKSKASAKHLINTRLEEERKRRDAVREKRAEAGRRGGRKSRRIKEKKQTEANAKQVLSIKTRSSSSSKTSGSKETVEIPPTLDTPQFREKWREWREYREEIRHPLKESTKRSQLATLAKWGAGRGIAAIDHTIFMGWQGLREPDKSTRPGHQVRSTESDPERRKALAGVSQKFDPDA